jgi:Cu(I)/Ag(I) efflux system membrane fusion protein
LKKFIFAGLAVGLILAGFFLGAWLTRRNATQAAAGARPSDAGPAAFETAGGDTGDYAPGAVNISPRKQQLIGIRVVEVKKETATHSLRVLGRVAANNTRLYIVNATTRGWILSLAAVTPGALVKKGDVLGSFYAPELLRAVQTYLSDVFTLDRLKGNPEAPSYKAAQFSVAQDRDVLISLGMGERQLEEIARTREWVPHVDIVSPTTGIVIAWNIFPALKFAEGTEFFRIADLSRVWILLDVFENETKYLKPGVRSKVSLAGQPVSFEAVVSNVLPLFDPVSRTMKVRLEANNPGYVLRPDMFVDVELPLRLPESIAVPADAVLDSGLKKTVFVERSAGYFEPREVQTGWKLGNEVEIVRGLKPGERIVVSGTFLIDSESRMETAVAGMQESLALDPVCGVPVSVKKAEGAGRKSTHLGKTYYFCSDECKVRFDENPEKYAESGGGRPLQNATREPN